MDVKTIHYFLFKNNLNSLENFFERALNSDFKKGISSEANELKFREEEYGHNRKSAREIDGFFFLNKTK